MIGIRMPLVLIIDPFTGRFIITSQAMEVFN